MWLFSWWVPLGLLLGVVIFVVIAILTSDQYDSGPISLLNFAISQAIAKLIGIWITCKLISVIVLFILHHN